MKMKTVRVIDGGPDSGDEFHCWEKGTIVRNCTEDEFERLGYDNYDRELFDTGAMFIEPGTDVIQHLFPTQYEEIHMETYDPAEKIEEILEILGGRKAATKEDVTEVLEKEETTLTATPWVDDGDGKESRSVPFSELFWKPKFCPDHLVRQFKGYEAQPVMATYIPPVAEFEQLSLAFSLGLKVNVVGPTGCGKDTVFEFYAASTGRPYLRIQHDTSFDPAAVFGQVHITAGDTDFVPGTLPVSMVDPTLVTLSELTRSTGASNMVYQRLLDRNELALPELKDTGKAIIKPHKDWLICASDNTKGNGEDMDKYPMSNVQDSAFLNRWDMIIEADYLSQDQEKELIKALAPGMNADGRKSLSKLSALIHAGYHKGEIMTAFSPRNLQAICKLVEAGVGLRKAIEMNYLSRVANSEKSDVNECIRAVFGA